MESLGETSQNIRLVLERWYWNALAYRQYIDEDYEGAERSLASADEAVRRGVERAPFLIMLANHCYDFNLQRARIARNRRRWEAMWRHIAIARAMVEDRVALCELSDGSQIFFSPEVDTFFRSISLDTDEDRSALAELVDPERRRRFHEALVADLESIPFFVIPDAGP